MLGMQVFIGQDAGIDSTGEEASRFGGTGHLLASCFDSLVFRCIALGGKEGIAGVRMLRI